MDKRRTPKHIRYNSGVFGGFLNHVKYHFFKIELFDIELIVTNLRLFCTLPKRC